MSDKRQTIEQPSQQGARVEVRGPSGHLYGMLDRESFILEVKRKGTPAEPIGLRAYLNDEIILDARLFPDVQVGQVMRLHHNNTVIIWVVTGVSPESRLIRGERLDLGRVLNGSTRADLFIPETAPQGTSTKSALDIIQNAIDKVGREAIERIDIPLLVKPSPFDAVRGHGLPSEGSYMTFFGYPARIDPTLSEGEVRLIGADGKMLQIINIS